MNARLIGSMGLAAALAFGTMAGKAEALDQPDDFPERPINLVVMYPAGGGMDVTARTFARLAEDVLGHEFRVENRVGGGGMVGHTYLAKDARADGYTIGVIANPFMFTDILLRDGPFTKDEFDPFLFINFAPAVWAVNRESEIGDLSFDEIVEYAEDETLQVAMMPESTFLFVSEFIERQKGVEFNYIPFDGGRAGVVALLAGDVDATAAFYSELEQYIDAGNLRPIAVANDERFPLLPDTPTFPEVGIDMEGQTWGAARFMTLPPGVPEERKRYLEQAFLKVLQSEEAEEAFAEVGIVLGPRGEEETKEIYESSFEALRDFLRDTGRLDD